MDWWTLAQPQDGVLSYRQLIEGGRSARAVTRAVSRGELTRLSRGVYLMGGAPLTYRVRLWAAVLATDGVLCWTTAGVLWGVHDDDREVHLCVPHTRRVAAPVGVRLHRCGVPRAALSTRSGMPCTSRRWTVLDLLASLPRQDASRLADRALQRGWLGHADLDARLSEHPCRPGNTQLRELAAQVGDGAAAQSERLLHAILRRAEITGWQPNHEVWSNGELVAVLDVAVLDRRLAIEVDGMAYHVDVERFRGDRSRQNALVGLGWTVLRFTWADLTERPGYVVATLRRHLPGR